MTIDQKTLQAIFKAIRDCFSRSDSYQNELAKALSPETGPRNGARYTCSSCNCTFKKSEIELDHHPEPVVPIGKYWHQLGVEDYYDRVWNLPVRPLCKPCHRKHTKSQNADRRAARKK